MRHLHHSDVAADAHRAVPGDRRRLRGRDHVHLLLADEEGAVEDAGRGDAEFREAPEVAHLPVR